MPRRLAEMDMDCSTCDVDTVAFAVPEQYREYTRGSATTLALCPRCLELQPAASAPADPAFEAVGDAFPTDAEAAIPMAILVGLLDQLALHRSEISELLSAVERAGVDPLLVIDRLAMDPDIETDIDLSVRRRQLEQLL